MNIEPIFNWFKVHKNQIEIDPSLGLKMGWDSFNDYYLFLYEENRLRSENKAGFYLCIERYNSLTLSEHAHIGNRRLLNFINQHPRRHSFHWTYISSDAGHSFTYYTPDDVPIRFGHLLSRMMVKLI